MYKEFLAGQVEKGKTSEARIVEACRRVLLARFRLGQFDPEEDVPFSKIPLSVVGCEKHRALALKSALESIVLLKNDGSASSAITAAIRSTRPCRRRTG